MDPRLRLPAFYVENILSHETSVREFPCTLARNSYLSYSCATQDPVTTIHFRKALPQGADLIFVLAGRDYRKHYGLQLFKLGLAPRLLFSVSRFEIRRFSRLPLPIPLDLLKLAADVPPPQRHFFVLFERSSVGASYVRPRRFGTLTEIEALWRWLQDHPGVQSIVLISSHSHLRRIRLCCKFLLRGALQIYLTSPTDQPSQSRDGNRLAAVLLEALKILAYGVVLAQVVRGQLR